MAPIAALYDIHGNAPALRAVLAEVALVPGAHVVVGGDIVWGPLPEETLELVRGLEDATVIRGNTDREIAERHSAEEGMDAAMEAILLGLRRRDRRRGPRLPRWAARRRRRATTCCSATHRRGPTPIRSHPRRAPAWSPRCSPAPRSRSSCSATRTCSSGATVAGHQLVNPGSVGMPSGPTGAHWALIDDDTVELRRTEYDVAAAARAFEARGLAGWDTFAARITAPPAIADIVDLFTIG